MNVTPLPTGRVQIKSDGTFNTDWLYYFSFNTQEQQRYFSNDGHLVPTRTNAELVGDNPDDRSLSTPQYTARFAYNGTTNNHMANTAGEFKNLTMNELSTHADIVAMTPLPNRIENYSDENNNLYTNINGTIYQNVTAPLTYPVRISSNGSQLFVNFNGTNYQFVLMAV